MDQDNNATWLDSETRFRTVLADPPWDIEQKGSRGAGRHYALLSLERIKAMPVRELMADDAHLWLWTTNATLRDGYDVAETWGFTVRSPLTWIKFRLGLGKYLRNATEHLLFATRGKAPVRFRSQPTWINAPLQEHSHKPEEVFSIIERVSDGPYLELFARRRPPTQAAGRCGATRLTPTSSSRDTQCRATMPKGRPIMTDDKKDLPSLGNLAARAFRASGLILGAVIARHYHHYP